MLWIEGGFLFVLLFDCTFCCSNCLGFKWDASRLRVRASEHGLDIAGTDCCYGGFFFLSAGIYL